MESQNQGSSAVTSPAESPGFGGRLQRMGRLLGRLIPLLKPHLGRLGLAVGLLIVTTALFQAGPLLIRRAVDHDMARGDDQGLMLTVGAYVLAQALLVVFSYRERILLETVGLRVITDLKLDLFRHVTGHALSFFNRWPTGKLVSRVESDTEKLRHLFTFTATTLLGDSLKLLVGIGVMLSVDPVLTGLVASTLLVILALTTLVEWYGTPLHQASREREAELTAFIEERLHAAPVLQAFNQEPRTIQEMDDLNRRKFSVEARLCWLWNTFFNLLTGLETVGICLTLGFGGWLILEGRQTVGTVLMFVEFIRRFFHPIIRLGEQLSVIQRALTGAERIFDLLDENHQVKNPLKPRSWSGLREGVTFRNVTFGYRPGEPVLKNLSFTIPRGEKWALVGPTGGGKSTIVGLLYRFFDPQEGAVLVDGIDVRAMDQATLRRRMALVLQDILIFPGTVRENLRLGLEWVTDRNIERAVDSTKASSVIDALQDGLDTTLAESGRDLSTGQRQLLSFARALARDPDILVLDEATSAVDPETERAVQRATETLLEGRTALIVAHRLTTIQNADRILVVQGGRIVEQGRHHELVARGGHYAKLHALQQHGTPSGGRPGTKERKEVRLAC